MLGHESGVIGLPLRLLAREVYGRVADNVGAAHVGLITGEEKLVPATARYLVCTVEAMPEQPNAAFVAVDEVQLASDLERGHVFTDRILHARGEQETLFLGAQTVQPLLERLVPGMHTVTRPRLSQLEYAGSKKITRLPERSAIVAFSSEEVYAIAELIRRQRGGAAVVMGALSPRTRNAQVALYQNGDVDFIVATDAIGMGLNLDVNHVAFAQDAKFDGFQHRRLTPMEMAQIAGRAGRHMNDGTFGVTGRVEPFEEDLVQRLESHDFEPLRLLQWRNRHLDFSSAEALLTTLAATPGVKGLARAPNASDQIAFEYVTNDARIRDQLTSAEAVGLLWRVCQLPDYRKLAPANHAQLIMTLFSDLHDTGTLSEAWLESQLQLSDRTDGDIDALSNRLSHVRTWSYVAHQADWLDDPAAMQDQTLELENKLSDVLHHRLTQRFIDRRTSVLMKRLKENKMLDVEIGPSGQVMVEGQPVGRLDGFRFTPESTAATPEGKAMRAAAQKALAGELEARTKKVSGAPDSDFALGSDGQIRWVGQVIARLEGGETELSPTVRLLADDHLPAALAESVETRLNLWTSTQIEGLLKPLFDLQNATDLDGIARGLAFQLVEHLGRVPRRQVLNDVRSLDQDARAVLRRYGVRFGAFHIYLPILLKPAASGLLATLWAAKAGQTDAAGVAEIPQLSASGRTSIAIDPSFERQLYGVCGFYLAGNRAVRIDILERLADMIRPLTSWRPGSGEKPEGAVDGGGFSVTVDMTSLLGCAGEDFNSILSSLGYRVERRPMTEEEKSAYLAARGGTAETPDASPPAEAEAAASDTSSEAGDNAAAPDAPSETSEDAAAPDPFVLEIWRQHSPKRHGGKPEGARRPGKPKGRKFAGKGQGERKKPTGPRQDAAPKNQREPDPDSPFAQLAALKSKLEGDS